MKAKKDPEYVDEPIMIRKGSKCVAFTDKPQKAKDADKVLSVLRKYEAWHGIDNETQDKMLKELGRLLAAERKTR